MKKKEGIEEQVIELLSDFYTDEENGIDLGSVITTIEIVKFRIIDYMMRDRRRNQKTQ